MVANSARVMGASGSKTFPGLPMMTPEVVSVETALLYQASAATSE